MLVRISADFRRRNFLGNALMGTSEPGSVKPQSGITGHCIPFYSVCCLTFDYGIGRKTGFCPAQIFHHCRRHLERRAVFDTIDGRAVKVISPWFEKRKEALSIIATSTAIIVRAAQLVHKQSIFKAFLVCRSSKSSRLRLEKMCYSANLIGQFSLLL